MESRDRVVLPGGSRDAVERELLARGAEPDADWATYRLPAVTSGAQRIPMRADLRLTAVGEDVVVDAVFRSHTPFAWQRAWFRVAALDARQVLRRALGAPPIAEDADERQSAEGQRERADERLVSRFIGARIVLGIAGLVCSIAGLAVSSHAHARPHPAPPALVYEPAALQLRLQWEDGLPETVCNDDRLLHIDHAGQVFTCTAAATTYSVEVTGVAPLTFRLLGSG